MAGHFAAAGSRCDQPVGLIDLYPTLVELCDLKDPNELDGQSLVPPMRDPQRKTGRGVVTMYDQGKVSLRTDRWRFIRYADGSEELYDHRNDPNEWTNLIDSTDHAETGKRLSMRLTQPLDE